MGTPQNIFESIGAEFLLPQYKISEKIQGIKAFVFDWDGVFNTGEKSANGSSTFNEIDSMGTNLLRFSYYLKTNKQPLTAIISGEKNETAFFFSKREHFNNSYFKFSNKLLALEHFCAQHNLKPGEVCYFFDDVLDLSIARVAGLRIFIPRKASIQFTNYVKQNHLADYLTGSFNNNYAVREACEMLMTANGLYDRTITLRMNFDETYKEYLKGRNAVPTEFYSLSDLAVTRVEL